MSDKLIVAVIDRSGSMGTIKEDMNGGLRAWLGEAVRADPEAELVSIMFDTTFDVTNERTPLKEVDVTSLLINPRGGTALNDAIMQGLSHIKKNESALVMIVTDGGENASREVKTDAVKKRIAQLEKQGVDFLYLSASPTAFADSQSYGFDRMTTQTGLPSSHSYAEMGSLSSVGTRVMTGQTVSYLSTQTPKDTKTKVSNKTP